MSTYNRRYISIDDSTIEANEDVLFLETTEIKILLEFKKRLEDFNSKLFKAFIFPVESRAYNNINAIISLLDTLIKSEGHKDCHS